MVIVFLICWTPYFIAASLHFADTDLSTGRKMGNIYIPPIISTFLHVYPAPLCPTLCCVSISSRQRLRLRLRPC